MFRSSPKSQLTYIVCVADSGYFGLVYYQLRSANSPFCHSKVRVGERNGEVRVKSGLDYEETEAFSCVIEALDHDLNMQPQHTSTAVLHVLLVDVNDNTPALKSAPLTFTGALHTTPSLLTTIFLPAHHFASLSV